MLWWVFANAKVCA